MNTPLSAFLLAFLSSLAAGYCFWSFFDLARSQDFSWTSLPRRIVGVVFLAMTGTAGICLLLVATKLLGMALYGL